ncbi:sensor histidine kinase [Streptomyces sp. 5.8]|uniref:sensor histidine kinase n=1 Tax=Streptomyces sp. 5.8 TaxID=3406571 RepID=UPI003BB7133A
MAAQDSPSPSPSEDSATGSRRPSRVDVAVALAACAYGVGEAFVFTGSGLLTGRPEWAAVAAGLLGLLLVWRSVAPLLVTAAVLAGHVTRNATAALVVVMYTMGSRYRSRPRLLAGFGVAAVASELWAVAASGFGLSPTDGIAYVAAPLLMGLQTAARKDLIVKEQARSAALERAQDLLTGQARAEERTRIAGELHDVVARRISQLVLAGGALQVGAERGTPWVRAEAERMRRTGVLALEEMREVVGVMRSGADAPVVPAPSMADLECLAEDFRHAGMDVRIVVRGRTQDLSSVVQSAVHRVVREALTNALKHAPGARVLAEVDRGPAAMTVRVDSGPAAPGRESGLPSAGFGLVGLAERLRLLGGTFTADRTADGGFLVRASVPLHRPDAEGGPETHETEPK